MTSSPFRSQRRRTINNQPDAITSEIPLHLLGGSVEAFLKSQGIISVTTVAKIIDLWPRIVGDQVAVHATPSIIFDGELVILVDHPAWATELRLLGAKILFQLENELKAPIVKRLKVHVRS